jgi:hypothetical protein
MELDRLMLQLRPTQPTPCTGLQLEIPIGGENGSTMGVANMTGENRNCLVPDTILRFFEGATLPELLPPNGG